MSLQDWQKKSDKQKAEDSNWISTRLGDEGSIKIDQYVGEQLVPSNYRDRDGNPLQQLEITFLNNALGKELKLARSYPFSKETDRFLSELIAVKDNPPFMIEKKTDKAGKAVFYARPLPQGQPEE